MGNRAAKSTAIIVMCAGVFLLAINDAIAKTLVARFDPFHIIFVRSAIALPFVTVMTFVNHGLAGLRSRRPAIYVFRSLLSVGAAYCFFISLRDLSLAEATSLVFAAPLFIAALSMPLLKQYVSLPRKLAVAAGFVGVLIILRPGSEVIQVASLTAIAAAFLYALIMMSARWIDDGDRFWTMSLYMTLLTGVFCSFVLGTEWPSLRTTDYLLFAGTALFSTVGLALITQAFRIADAAAVAPLDYTALLWATILGWIFWDTIPGPRVYIGAAVIIIAGIVLILADRQQPEKAASASSSST